tara:strand:- start:172 stop:369 length:198 start_codon:yes stop_codon:yes gene_type:complete
MWGELRGGTPIPATPEEKYHGGSSILLPVMFFGKVSVENKFASADYFVGQVLGSLDWSGNLGSVS